MTIVSSQHTSSHRDSENLRGEADNVYLRLLGVFFELDHWHVKDVCKRRRIVFENWS